MLLKCVLFYLCVVNMVITGDSNNNGCSCCKSPDEALDEIIKAADKLNKFKHTPDTCKDHAIKTVVGFTAVSHFAGPLPDGPIIYDQVIANIGNGYNSSTGKFTAPVSGLYSISVSMMGLHSNTLYIYIRKNGKELLRLYTRGGGLHEVASHTMNLPLKKGDQMWNSGSVGKQIYGSETYNVFSGALIAEGDF